MAAVEKEAGALASSLAAEIYRLHIVADHIEDAGGNQTRFMVLAKSYGEATGSDKTSLIFSVRHKAGSLYDALQSFKRFGLNMTKIESRPSKSRAWEYCFFVDIEGHAGDKKMKAAIEDLQAHCAFLRVLGSYPRAR
jgi:chorismate mutase/prephenate dehydratase